MEFENDLGKPWKFQDGDFTVYRSSVWSPPGCHPVGCGIKIYVDANGKPSMDLDVNPNGSVWAIEGITSPDGRVLGKMGHSERSGAGLYKNVPGTLYQPIFEGGVKYFVD